MSPDRPRAADPVQVRPARPEDARGIAALHVASWRAHYRGILPDAMIDGMVLEEQIARRSKQLAEPAPGVLHTVVEQTITDGASEVRGWCCSGPVRDADLDLPGRDPRVLELYALYVDPPFVGTGFGRALQEDFLARARRAGCEEVVLWVLPENRLARRFYASAGYRDDERAQERPLGDTGVYTRRMRRSL